jgi:carboxyl-terminal processing protease
MGFLAAVLAVVLLAAPGCKTATIPLTSIPLPVPSLPFRLDFWRQHDRDFSNMTWLASFDAVHETLAAEYPFTEHKGLDWEALRAEYRPRIADAAERDDEVAFYLALREYVYAVPDGNMGLYHHEAAKYADIGGGYGFCAMPLDDGRVIAHVVLPGGPAAEAGMEWGAEIVAWNGAPAAEALNASRVIWADSPPATAEARMMEQARFLGRAAVNAQAELVFHNPGAEKPHGVTIAAVDDGYAALSASYLHETAEGEFASPLTSSVLPDGHGYIRLHFMAPTITVPFPLQEFRGTMAKMKRNNVPGVVLDIRGSTGGARDLVAAMLGHFVTEEVFFEDIVLYDRAQRAFEDEPRTRVTVTPRTPEYAGPLAIVVDHRTSGAAEGIPMALQGRENTVIAGFTGTHGSFAPSGGYIGLPRGNAVYHPLGRSVDADGRVQLESDAAGHGGVAPTARVPRDVEHIEAAWRNGGDPVLDAAVEALAAMAR